jgi:hypothetical protein
MVAMPNDSRHSNDSRRSNDSALSDASKLQGSWLSDFGKSPGHISPRFHFRRFQLAVARWRGQIRRNLLMVRPMGLQPRRHRAIVHRAIVHQLNLLKISRRPQLLIKPPQNQRLISPAPKSQMEVSLVHPNRVATSQLRRSQTETSRRLQSSFIQDRVMAVDTSMKPPRPQLRPPPAPPSSI